MGYNVNMQLNELKDQYLDYLEIEKQRSRRTRENYEHYLGRFLLWAKISRPEQIDDELVRKYRLWLNRFEDEHGDSLKKSTQNYHIIALRGFLKYLTKRGVKTLGAERVELGRASDRDIDFLEEDEVARLLNAPGEGSLQALRDRAILEILYCTGLRVSELISLNRDSINLKRDDGFSVRGKGEKVRMVFLSPGAQETLKAYLNKRDDVDEALFIRVPKSEREMRQADELRLTARSVQRIVKKYAAKAGITKDVHPHTLRHSFATDLLRNGADVRSVQALLGHSSITTTQVYTHVTDRQLKEIHKKYHSKGD